MFNSYIVLFMNRVVFYFLTHVSWQHSNCDLMFVPLIVIKLPPEILTTQQTHKTIILGRCHCIALEHAL